MSDIFHFSGNSVDHNTKTKLASTEYLPDKCPARSSILQDILIICWQNLVSRCVMAESVEDLQIVVFTV